MRVRAAISPHGGDGKSRTAPHFLNALRTSFSVLALLSLACLRRADCARACKTYQLMPLVFHFPEIPFLRETHKS